ncbi:TetR/AcrR family transcriptional regulator [Spongiibacter sp. KMU-158]|uniref:TetR/AcrR family transcriptional regulator n=1 Tax=Spongiibacter pelagi TaxID=2760804 RepID=A0A927C252_9GAMM|nr:TetR/AcrR family transcriptional regulator [Spongiibacter pelagi]MBD2858100.1 TetR/AcrR family transcriptional regulator [Spongiibacter pelagi]
MEIQRRKPKQQRSIEKYEAVLDACTQVLAEFGFEKATVLELSLVSGVAVPTIYQYFPSKEAIYFAWYERTLDQVLEQLLEVGREEKAADLEEFIVLMLRGALHTIDLYHESLRKLVMDLPQVLLSHIINTVDEKTAETIMQLATEYLGQEPNPNLQPKLKLIISVLVGFIIQRVLRDQNPNEVLEDTIAELAELVFSYLGDLATAENATPTKNH